MQTSISKWSDFEEIQQNKQNSLDDSILFRICFDDGEENQNHFLFRFWWIFLSFNFVFIPADNDDLHVRTSNENAVA